LTFTVPAPRPDEDFATESVDQSEVAVWYHVYSTEDHPNTATTFSEGWGDTRFAPIYCPDGSPVHTCYAASTFDCAVMESVLHENPLSPPGVFYVDCLKHYRLARIELDYPLECVSFHTPYLPALDLTRAQLIDSLPAYYAQTRAWAQAAFNQRPAAHALAYGSRRHDAGRCVMLFGQRLPNPRFRVLGDEAMALDPLRQRVLQLVRRLKLPQI
jgi:hypothetical protein